MNPEPVYDQACCVCYELESEERRLAVISVEVLLPGAGEILRRTRRAHPEELAVAFRYLGHEVARMPWAAR